jgi:hypothetical protein
MGMSGDKRDAYKFLVGKPEGKKSFVRSRRRLDFNIKMDLQEIC